MWDVNTEFSDRDVIAIYRAYGKSEQFYSEVKMDLCAEQFLFEKFGTDELVLDLIHLAYNLLRAIGQLSVGIRDIMMKRLVKRCIF